MSEVMSKYSNSTEYHEISCYSQYFLMPESHIKFYGFFVVSLHHRYHFAFSQNVFQKSSEDKRIFNGKNMSTEYVEGTAPTFSFLHYRGFQRSRDHLILVNKEGYKQNTLEILFQHSSLLFCCQLYLACCQSFLQRIKSSKLQGEGLSLGIEIERQSKEYVFIFNVVLQNQINCIFGY